MPDAIDPATLPTEAAAPPPAPSAMRHGRVILLLVACALFVTAYLLITPVEILIARHYLPIDFDQGQVTAVNASWVNHGEVTLDISPDLVRSMVLAKYGWWMPPFLLHTGPSANGFVAFDGDGDVPLKIPWTVQLHKAIDPPQLTGRIPASQLAPILAPYTDLSNGFMSLKLSLDQARLWVGTGLSGRYQAGLTASGTMQVGYGSSTTTVLIKRIAAHTPVTFVKVADGWSLQLAIQLDSIDLSDPRYAVLDLPASRAQLSQLIMSKLTPVLAGVVIPAWCPRTVEVELSVGPAP